MHRILIALTLAVSIVPCLSKKVHYIHWNRNNPMFRIDNTDHIMDVNTGNLPWEYDQVNIICPTSKPGAKFPESHVIYSVTQDEYESCRITNPKPRIVAICNRPHRLMYFTITFRSFTPTPGGLEFHPGQDYYFISTSSREDLHRRVGGGCSTDNMKMIFKVHDNRPKDLPEVFEDPILASNEILASSSSPDAFKTTTPPTTMRSPKVVFNTHAPKHRGEYIYYYHPRDLIELENSISQKKVDFGPSAENEVWQNEALRYTSSSASSSSTLVSLSVSNLVALFTALSLLLWRHH